MNPNLGHPVKNKNKVQVKQWAKWNNHAKRIFNDMFYALRPSMQTTISHPEALALPADHWQTIRWNAAWLAADAANETGGATRAVQIRQPVTGKAAAEIVRVVAKPAVVETSKKRKAWARHVKKLARRAKTKKAALKSKAKRRGR